MSARLAENDSEIFIDGPNYAWVLDRIHIDRAPRTYLEIGTEFGHTLRLSRSRTVAIDPHFQLAGMIIDRSRITLREMGSDDYFARHRPEDDLGGAIDLAFLDGMHEFPFLLRDFINTEKAMAAGAIVAMHDCLPRDAHMTRLACDLSVSRPTNYPGYWTGDVWKMIPVLRKYRPDLDVRCLDAPPTGLTIVRNLDPSNTVLSDAYDDILRDWEQLRLEDYGMARLFADSRVESGQAWVDTITPTYKSLLFGLGRLVQPRRRLRQAMTAVGLGAR